MTEAEWLVCEDPQRMLEFLRGQSTQRKLRLFLCACCRHLWDRNTPKAIKRAIKVAEKYADAVVGKETFSKMQQETAAFRCDLLDPLSMLAGWALCPNAREAAEAMEDFARKEVRRPHADLLREVIGNLFRTTKVDPSWLAWSNGTVVKLAQGIYDDRRFEDLPILADALEEAGCREQSVLDHLRGPGPHVRGCWPLDLILGRA